MQVSHCPDRLPVCQDSEERAIPLLRPDLVCILAAAAQTLLRRDMSLNRRLYAWLLGTGSTQQVRASTGNPWRIGGRDFALVA